MKDEQEMTIRHLARVEMVSASNAPTLSELVRAAGFMDEGAMEQYPPYFFRAEISNNLLDSHYTRMSDSTLRNYAEDASKGVAFLRGHSWHELPIGYSLTGTVEDDGTRKRVVSDFYTATGNPETDDLVFRMKNGLVRDVSVGFGGGRMICDVCGRDFFDCNHYPGLAYETKENNVLTSKVATFTIEDARLSEVSGVFDGSTPQAMLIKAQRAAKSGELTVEQVELLESRYRIHLPHPRSFASANTDLEPKKEKMMEEKYVEKLREVLVGKELIQVEEGEEVRDEQIVEAVQTLVSRLPELEEKAADGVRYRANLMEEALREGIRSKGNSFDKEMYVGLLENAPIATIARLRDQWRDEANLQFPVGRRSAEETEAKTEKVKAKDLVPDEAYQ